MNVPEVGDYLTHPDWHGEYYKVLRVDHAERFVTLEYKNARGDLDEIEYPFENDWIFRSRKRRYEMEDTREYLDTLEKVYDRYFGL